jgi:predicted nucleic acid-binding protein
MRQLLIVSDTSALSALAITGWLEWLRLRWGAVAVPEAVWRELGEIGHDQGSQDLHKARSDGWLAVHAVEDREQVADLVKILDQGESEAIALAIQLDASALLIDEKDGREIARSFGLPTTGTLGLIVWAKRGGLISSAKDSLETLVTKTRFYVFDAVRKEVLNLAGETAQDV